jgi:DNA-binding PadR family transcriptional regulator
LTRIPLGPADVHVLLSLSHGRLHGLGIAEDVARVTDNQVLLGPATLYRTLGELAAEGLVQLVEQEDPGEDPRRKHYEITPTGVDRLSRDIALLERVARAGRKRLSLLQLREVKQ